MAAGRNALLWRKAAVLGGLWASSEIVLGSFLHNARLPFSGELLTCIGVALLAAGHRLWPERGLLWRSGLVCAAMKSVSPSAVILGPMVSIAMEGFLMEAGVALLGGNAAGYALAGGLTLLGTLAYKLVKLFMVYGPDTVRVYLRGVQWLRGLGLPVHGASGPLLAAAAVYFLAGCAAALAGLKAGEDAEGCAAASGAGFKRPSSEKPRARYHSPGVLAAHGVFIAAVLASGKSVPVYALAGGAAGYGALCAALYPRARRLLGRAGLWAGVASASASAGLLLGSLPAGVYMALRAFLVTIGFSAIGEELANPALRRLLERLFGGVFFETLEYSFVSLPGIIAGLPSARDFARRPLACLGTAVRRAPHLLENAGGRPVFLITGRRGAGKSGLARELAELLKSSGRSPGGIRADGFWENGRRGGFDLVDLFDGSRVPLCRRGVREKVMAGEFGFFSAGLAAGAAALSTEKLASADVVFIDEIGPLELEEGGWAPALRAFLDGGGACPLVLTVREELVEAVCSRWGLRPSAVWRAGETAAENAFASLLVCIDAARPSR